MLPSGLISPDSAGRTGLPLLFAVLEVDLWIGRTSGLTKRGKPGSASDGHVTAGWGGALPPSLAAAEFTVRPSA